MHPTNALCDIARDTFKRLCVHPQSIFENSDAVHVPGMGSLALLTRWFHSAGTSMKELSLDDPLDAPSLAIDSMLDALEENCHNLRRLAISGFHRPNFIPAILEKTRGRLNELETNSMNSAVIDAVERNCTGLRKLHMWSTSSCISGALRVV